MATQSLVLGERVLSGLYAITDGSVGQALWYKVEQALQGGTALVQYRDKSSDTEQRLIDAQVLRDLCRQYSALFLVNDDVVLAKQVQADGVHIGREDADLSEARAYLGTNFVIGTSCYNQLALALPSQAQGADYVAFGSFFSSLTKPLAQRADITLLQQAKPQLKIPICAIGGITLATAPNLISAGADMLAVISDLFNSAAISQQAQAYAQLFASESAQMTKSPLV
jgi:thiamine-phosphate pyrophosphorylase